MDEIVTSIRKTEESLLRLKRLRKGGDTGVAAGTPGGADMSDENKIRKQLYLDAEEFGKQVSQNSLPPVADCVSLFNIQI